MLHQCKECDYTASNKLTIKKHFNTKHINTEKWDKVFDSMGLLDSHMHKHNNDEPSNIKETNSRTILPYECSLCEDNFSSQEDYDTHVNENFQEIN